MDRYYDYVDEPHFWDAVLFEPGKVATRAFDIVAGLAGWVLEDPYRGEIVFSDVRILHSEPVVHEDAIYAYRVAYRVEEYPAPRDGKSGLVMFIKAEPYDPNEMAEELTPTH